MEDEKFVKLVCRECEHIEKLPLKIVVYGAVISCSECGGLIVESKGSQE